MKFASYLIPAALVAGLAAPMVSAEEAPEPEAGSWGGKIALGAIATGGNSETSTLNGEFGLSYARGIWHNAFSASAIKARAETTDDAGVTTTNTSSERYSASLRSALDFTEFDYLFALLEYEKDLFAGVRERSVQSIGYGRRVIKADAHALDLELGVGARQILAQEAGAQRESELITRAGMSYVWQISETSRFSQRISVEAGDANTYTESFSELKLAVIGGLFANLGFSWKNNSQVPAGSENVDTVTSVSLSYEYGG